MSVLEALLRSPRFEVIPAKGTEQAVVQWVPAGMTVTVTASPVKGLEPTIELAERLAARGYRVRRSRRRRPKHQTSVRRRATRTDCRSTPSSRNPAFSSTRREAPFPTTTYAPIRSRPIVANPYWQASRTASVAYPCPHAARRIQ